MAAKGSDPKDAAAAYSLAAIQPETFGKYTLIGKLGHGGMAEVNLAVSEGKGGFRKLVVIKRLHRHLAMEDGFVDMFLDEARLAARLNHPHCVQTNEVGEWSDNHFLAMEYLDGQGLERLLRMAGSKEEDIPFGLCARIISDALDGLAYAHELTDFDGTPLSVVHRDVSPQNIFVTYNGMVKLLDFGIAKAATHVVETKTGVIKGKYAYIAPEQALGQDVDQRSDIWSMGVVLWEVLTGRRLFKSVNELATLHETLKGEVKLPSVFRPDMPTELDTICMRALTRDPEQRYQTAQDMKDDLDRYLLSLPKAPGRKHIARLMRTTFDEVISTHKSTLAECLKGTAMISPASIERIVDPSSISSASGIRMSDPSGITPTPTPAPMGNAPSVTPPPYSYTPPPMTPPVGAPVPPAEDRKGKVIIALLAMILVVLVAIIAGLLVPLGDDEEDGDRLASSDPPAQVPAQLPAQTPPATNPDQVQIEAQHFDSPGADSPGADSPGTDSFGADSPGAEANGGIGDDPPTNDSMAVDDRSGETGVEPGDATTDTAEPATADPNVEAEASSPRSDSAAARRRRDRRRRAEAAAREAAAQQAAAQPVEPERPERPAAAETGRLTLATTPWTHVFLNGRDLGTTPLINVEIPAGSHRLRLVNREQGIDEPYSVNVPSGQRVTRRLGLR
ncbi:MAG: protein kinase [Sandaracinaceae bacterium]